MAAKPLHIRAIFSVGEYTNEFTPLIFIKAKDQDGQILEARRHNAMVDVCSDLTIRLLCFFKCTESRVSVCAVFCFVCEKMTHGVLNSSEVKESMANCLYRTCKSIDNGASQLFHTCSSAFAGIFWHYLTMVRSACSVFHIISDSLPL